MIGPLKLAWQYVWFHKTKSLILIACIFLTALLPIAIKLLLWQFNQKLVLRADSTPAVIGAKGSDLDLTLSTLYFKPDVVDTIPYAEVARVRDSNLAAAIPIHVMFTARGFSVVGTSLEYFDFRSLKLASGSKFAILGDCMIGSQVATTLDVQPGDQIISDRDNVLNLAGQAPLKLTVAGVLQASRTPDDWAVFVDLKTAWVIQGLGHGHQDLSNEAADSEKLLSKSDNNIVASSGIAAYIEITPDNIDSFHFHGELEEFPITSIIAVPDSTKNATLLEGRYSSGSVQYAKPGEVVRTLMAMVFRVKQFFDANAILIAISTGLLLFLVILLSLRLRKREMETMFKLGCSRHTIALLQVGEMAIIFGVALVLLAFAVWSLWLVSGDLVQTLLVNSA